MAPDAVLYDLRLRAPAIGTGEEAIRIPLGDRLRIERETLLLWAREKEVAYKAEEYLSKVRDTHGEHHVYFDAARERWFKITHASDSDGGGFALTVDTDFLVGKKTQRYIGVPFLREATPFEYISRLQLFNRTFSDFIEFEGVIDEPGREAIITSQDRIQGEASTDEEVEAFMRARRFAAVPGVVAGRRNSLSYYRESDRVAVFDTHGQNFLTFGSRTVPIDALITVADDDLAAFLNLSPAERREEVGLWTSLINES